METTQHQIMTRIRRQFGGGGAVVTPKDFLDLAGRDAVDQALNRLVRAGRLVRVARGLYHQPRTNRSLGITIPPDPDQVADALGRQTGSRVAPSPAMVANQLGLSTQIPAKPVYLTTGRSRTVQVAGRTFRLKQTPPHKMSDVGTLVGQVLLALEALGPDPDRARLETLRGALSQRDRARLIEQARYRSARVASLARQIAADPDPAT